MPSSQALEGTRLPRSSPGGGTPRGEYWAPRRVLGRDVRRMIAALDPEHDDAEITHLSLEVLTSPMMAHIGYAGAAVQTVSVPRVAARLYREGKGDQILHPWKRDADTLTYFGTLIRRGHRSPEGAAICERIQQIHRSVKGVLNEDQVYTLGMLMFFSENLEAALGQGFYSEAENLARHNFWRGVARVMRLRQVPETRAEFRAWIEDYQRRHFEPSPEAHAISEAHIRAIEHWFPGPAKPLARAIFVTVMDARVRECAGYDRPAAGVVVGVRAASRAISASTAARPVRLDSSWAKSFSRAGPEPDLRRIGYGTYSG